MQDQRADLEWREGGIPVSTRFDDPYYSLENGLAETAHVFLSGNDLPARFCDGFHIAELGFGTGLNALCTAKAWRGCGIAGALRFTSFEAYPMAGEEMARALAAFPEVADLAAPFVQAWGAGERRIELPGHVQIEVIEGDARATLCDWDGTADAWFLDGFSPAKNPELWGEDILAQVSRHTATGGTAATYTAAGFVRRGLAQAGFEVNREPGFGRKRHMTTARKIDT